MSEQPFRNPELVTLCAAAEINGRKYQATTVASVRHWNEDSHYQEHMKAKTLRDLAEAIVNELAPEVVVMMPEPTPHDSLTKALRPFDYPLEY